MKLFLSLAVATGLLATPALADPAAGGASTPAVTPAATPATAPAPAPDDPNKLICKTKAKTGSRFPEKTCMTKAQWDELWGKSRDVTTRDQLRGYRANGGGGGG